MYIMLNDLFNSALRKPLLSGQRNFSNLPGNSSNRHPRQTPLVLAPTAGALLTAVVHDRIPQAVGFGLVVSRNLERKSLAVLERRATIQAETGDSDYGELHRQNVAQLARGIVAGRTMDRSHRAVRERLGVELAASKAVPSYQRQIVFLGTIFVLHS